MYSRRVKDLLTQHPTPFYLYDMDLLDRTLVELNRAAASRHYKVHYAMKANSNRPIMERVIGSGIGVDCVSGNEIQWAIECGVEPSKIVFAGVGKSDSEIATALDAGIGMFHCESLNELEVIDMIAAERGVVAPVALRINPDIDPKTHSYITTGKAECKFGISSREIETIIARLNRWHNVSLNGLHFHIGSQITDMEVYRALARRVNQLWPWFVDAGINTSYLNLGGGLGIDYEAPDDAPMADFNAYFDAFASTLKLDPAPREIHFELGRAVVGQCGELISHVLYRKTTTAGREIAIIDASMTELIRPALYGAHHAIENLCADARDMQRCSVVGTVCESSDNFACNASIPELRRGDLISIKSTGAYGQSMASQYNMHALPTALYSDRLEEYLRF